MYEQKPNDRDTKKIKQKPKDDEYELSRFKPLLRTVIEVRSITVVHLTIYLHNSVGSRRKQIRYIPLPLCGRHAGSGRRQFKNSAAPNDFLTQLQTQLA
jgi:hypothetical protein